jgi:hypothetical protein
MSKTSRLILAVLAVSFVGAAATYACPAHALPPDPCVWAH